MFDYLIVGAGLFGSVLANILTTNGKSVLVVEKKPNVGGTVYTENIDGITVHKYGAHIFRTNNKNIWNYINKFSAFKPFINSPLAVYEDKVYNLPFNMNTFSKLWNIRFPYEAEKIIHDQCIKLDREPANLEEFALSVVGKDIYEKFIKGYTEKQWGKDCKNLPATIMNRIPVRYTYNNNYYNALYQGVPIKGYTYIVEKLLENSTVLLGIDGKEFIKNNKDIASSIIYTGCIDEFFDFSLGKLEYRSLKFEHEVLSVSDYQGNAVVNYTSRSVPWTRIIEHKHFLSEDCPYTIITKEYPILSSDTFDPYYPVRTEFNVQLYNKYLEMSDNIIFAGRLGSFRYTDMEETISMATSLATKLLRKEGTYFEN